MIRAEFGAPANEFSDRRADPSSKNSRKGEDHTAIVYSNKDPASKNIGENLKAHHGFLPSGKDRVSVNSIYNSQLIEVDEICIYVQPESLPTGASQIIFASKHVSAANHPALTVHATGNLTKAAEYGGKPEEVSLVNPLAVSHALRVLKREVERSMLDIDVTMEATHHGPTSFQVPVCFVEIGSGPSEWMNPALGRIAADAIMSAVNRSDSEKPVVGFGGTHYSPKFTRMNLEGEFQVGHIVPRFVIEAGVTDSVLRDTFNKTSRDCNTALIDWKGLNGEDRRLLTSKLKNWGLQIERR